MSEQDRDKKHKVRDWWDKLDIISKFVTAGLVTVITIIGSFYLNKQQDSTRSTQLYSQFMSEREKAENQVRKDMFEKVLAEFWHQRDDKGCILDEIDQQLLQLELISRNFHETLDLSPLFTHVLLKIVRNINTDRLAFPEDQILSLGKTGVDIKFRDACSKTAYARLLRQDNKLFNKELISFGIGKDNDQFEAWKQNACPPGGPEQRCIHRYILWRHINNIKEYRKQKLIKMARRITAKQMESLSDVVKRIRLQVDLKTTCADTRPNGKFIDDEICYQFVDRKRKMAELIDNHARARPLPGDKKNKDYGACDIDYRLDDGNGDSAPPQIGTADGIRLTLDDKTWRCFRFSVRRSYPQWNQIYVEVMTNRTQKEINSDRDGGHADQAGFWVGFFDFPLADNTYLSNKERFSVVLEKLDEDKQLAEVSLIYFPATYAGFKEKAFYQQRMLNTLLKDK